MALLHYLWSRTAASNSSADANVNWAEGQAPSSVNDSARAMMASAAGFRDDIAGAIVTGGTSTAYTVGSYQVFDTLAHMSGQVIAFTPHATNGATVTLNVDGLGAKPLRSSTGVELLAGTLIAGTPYSATYNNSDAVWYLHNFYGNPYNIPLGSGLDYWGSTAPNSSFVFPIGQAISRTTYATLFTLFSTQYGVGDGSTTFNLPDKTGRVSAMKEATATRLTTAGGGVDGGTLGAVGGAQNVTLTAAQLPSSIPYTDPGHAHVERGDGGSGGVANRLVQVLGTASNDASTLSTSSATTGITINPSGGGSHFNTQPTVVCNYILRII